ncbi:MAG TPA: thermonuclease family protein [Kofleriaceae bacterium]|nr:thermonuclease family protein [Kofleriaceae bacterium]
MTKSRTLLAVLAGAATLALAAGCPPPVTARYQRQQAQASLRKLGAPGLVLGEFTLTKVLDGDTVRVDGLDSSLRLLAIDTEETFKNQYDVRGADTDFEQYLESKKIGNHPAKAATPLGEEGKVFAKNFFHGHDHVRLERDDPAEIRDIYDRYLAYVFVQIDGKWVNYNIEAVRAGMAPYFMKYGYSKRFHQEFVDAEKEARDAHRGIWDPTKQHYPDYDARYAWWSARADFLARYQRQAENDPNFIVLTHWDAEKRLEDREGQEVSVLAMVNDIQLGDRGPTKVLLARKRTESFPLIFFDKDVFAASHIADWHGEFVVARGVVTSYTNKHTHRKQFQIVIDHADQLTLSAVPGLVPPPSTAGVATSPAPAGSASTSTASTPSP